MTVLRRLTLLLLCALGCSALLAQTAPRLINLSFRANNSTGLGAMSSSFVIEGTGTKTVLLRVAGPALAAFGITGVLSDPTLSLYNASGTKIAENDNWNSSDASAFALVGAFAFPAGSRDSAIVTSLAPGVYTMVVSGAGTGTGVALLEVYETAAATSRFAYLAARTFVGTGSNILVSGAVLGGTGSASVLVRGLGPTLTASGVSGALADPTISVFSGSSALATNDNWSGTPVSDAVTTAALTPFAASGRDSGLLLTLPPGAYTAQLSGVGGTTGIGMVEFAHADASRSATIAPALLLPPHAVTVDAGTTLSLPALALGKPTPTFQWRKNGTNIAGATSAGLTLANIQVADAGDYTVVMANSAGTVTSAPFTVSVVAVNLPPSITTQPAGQAVAAGGTATFSVTAAGTAPLTYQWLKDGAAIGGATAATLTIPNVQAANLGNYSVRVTNAFGSATSSAVPLALAVPPTITVQPVSQSVPAGTPVRLSVAAAGSEPLRYQWRKDGTNVAGATNAALSLTSPQVSDTGSYTCVVTNAAGSVTSNPATLTITRSFAGTYFGAFDGGRGNWAMVIRPDGTGTFVAFVTNPRGGVIVTFRVDADGRFRTTSTLIQPGATAASELGRPVAAAGVEFTLAGSINSSNGVSGSLEGLGIPLNGGKEAPDGDTGAVSGIYQASGPNNTTTVAVVGSSRQVVALTIGATSVDGGLGTVGSNGAFTVTTPNNTAIAGTITSGTGTVTGTVTTAGTAPVAVTGSSTGGLGPPTITNAPPAQTVARNAEVVLSITAGGKTPLTYQWRKDGTAIAGATAATFTIPSAQVANAGSYTCVVTNSEGSVTSAAIPLTVTVPGPTARLVNLSIFTELSSATDSFTMGYVLSADASGAAKPLVIRAVGPSLGALGVDGTVADPKLETFAGTTKTGENDNWGGSPAIATAMAGVGAFAFTGPASRDAAVVANVTTADNSVKVSATGSGNLIAEIYDATPNEPGSRRLANVSVLKPVGAGLTAGFVIGGTGTKTVLIRAVGPTLASLGVSDAISDPQLTLFAGTTQIRSNDNWGGTAELTAAFTSVGAFALPAQSRDAAILTTLEPGSYSARVTGVGTASGTVIVEVYEVP